MTFRVEYHPKARERLLALDPSVQARMVKRAKRMAEEDPGRHLRHGYDFFIIEMGKYRIAYTRRNGLKMIYFAGDHKDYERWYRSL